MIKNYFYLLRNVIELNKVLTGATINEFYSQEKDKLYLRLASKENPHKHLFISADQNLPYLFLKNDHRKAKKNTINFWDEFVPGKLKNIEAAINERVIKFNFNNFQLYFIIRGNLTNIFLINDSNEITSFKKSKRDETFFRVIINELNFISSEDQIISELANVNDLDFPAFRKNFPHIGREIYEEAKYLVSGNPSTNFNEAIKHVVISIIEKDIVVHYDKNSTKIFLAPKDFSKCKLINNPDLFENFNSAIKFYISEYFQNYEFNKLSKELEAYFDKELQRFSDKINKLNFRIDKGSKENEYRKQANLLLANIHILSKGLQSICITDYETNNEITIKLKDTNSPNQNVNLYFDKAKDEKINYGISLELYKSSLDKYEALSKQKDIFDSSKSINELREIKKQLKIGNIKKLKKETKLDIKYKQYRIDDRYDVYVGKDSKSNDLLTTKFAKQNDYWFHARGLPGSHVILRSDKPKEVVPKPVLKKAACIAAFHSKAKTAGIVPVSYTFAKFVYKKKGLDAGQVYLTKEKVLTVQPRIPSDCELINE